VTRRSAVAGLALLALAGCPIPQPLPEYPPGQPITPPRIVVDDTVHVISPSDTVVRVPASCPSAPVFSLQAMLRHDRTDEAVSARWFVNYDPTSQQRSAYLPNSGEIPPPGANATDPTLRTVPAFSFRPYDFPPVAATGAASSSVGAVNVVELVLSNGFDPAYDKPPPEVPLPYRKPLLNYEVQVYRWVFVTTPEDPTTCTGTACVRCPAP
jgi:hypothetical protein